MALVWEKLNTSGTGFLNMLQTWRAKVPGGWLVAAIETGMTFYPDPQHLWDGSSLP